MTQKFSTISRPSKYSYFRALIAYKRASRTHLCGYDLNLTYPQNGLFPTLQQPSATDPNSPFFFTGPPKKRSYMSSRARTKLHAVEKLAKRGAELHKRGEHPLKRDAKLQARHATWKRDLTGRSNGTIDSWYACFLLDELYDYMTNFTFPYCECNCQVSWLGICIDHLSRYVRNGIIVTKPLIMALLWMLVSHFIIRFQL